MLRGCVREDAKIGRIVEGDEVKFYGGGTTRQLRKGEGAKQFVSWHC